ncbi:glutaredoxin [Selaginella moellendorffii]|uniref:glutaredoxin n=1 Tax=Selaginella moellendorffii TaxID=88036 RepID=UPI000D1C8FA6|nr:glutaredoxin [Selaginella moellendorffii]|eukprot:XP_002973274.2 glutaredoxin [Selaginella moellendorffii]
MGECVNPSPNAVQCRHRTTDFRLLRRQNREIGRSVVVKSMSSSQSQTDDLIKSKNEHNPVVIYSKSWCPYCSKVKGLFKKLGVKVVVVELDELVEEADVQAALKRMTGQSTVPNVFIGGKHVGGCDDTHRLHSQGKLIPMLQGAKAQMQG